MYYIISNIIIAHLRSTRAQFSIIHVMDGQEIEQNLHIESGQSPSYEHAERTEKVKKHQTMTFNQVLFLEKIESIVGVLSSCDGWPRNRTKSSYRVRSVTFI